MFDGTFSAGTPSASRTHAVDAIVGLVREEPVDLIERDAVLRTSSRTTSGSLVTAILNRSRPSMRGMWSSSSSIHGAQCGRRVKPPPSM